MRRYYNRKTKCEVFKLGPHCVVLDPSSPFLSPLPEGKRLTYKDDIPTGLEDIPVDVDSLISGHNEGLERHCKKYQVIAGCDSNLYALSIGLRSAGGDGEKLLEVIAWVDQLWKDYFSRKLEVGGEFTPDSLDFSNNGKCPYSFTEVRREAGV